MMKILIIDDSRFLQNFLIKILKTYVPEAAIIVAGNGVQGLELFKSENPDFVLTDLLMPEMNGQDLLKEIRKINLNAKIIVISADIQKATRDEVEELGILAFFNKPFNNEKATELVNLIKEAASDA